MKDKKRSIMNWYNRYRGIKSGQKLFYVYSLDRLSLASSLSQLKLKTRGHENNSVEVKSIFNKLVFIIWNKVVMVLPSEASNTCVLNS